MYVVRKVFKRRLYQTWRARSLPMSNCIVADRPVSERVQRWYGLIPHLEISHQRVAEHYNGTTGRPFDKNVKLDVIDADCADSHDDVVRLRIWAGG